MRHKPPQGQRWISRQSQTKEKNMKKMIAMALMCAAGFAFAQEAAQPEAPQGLPPPPPPPCQMTDRPACPAPGPQCACPKDECKCPKPECKCTGECKCPPPPPPFCDKAGRPCPPPPACDKVAPRGMPQFEKCNCCPDCKGVIIPEDFFTRGPRHGMKHGRRHGKGHGRMGPRPHRHGMRPIPPPPPAPEAAAPEAPAPEAPVAAPEAPVVEAPAAEVEAPAAE